MKYTLNDTTAYGIYNGISEYDIGEILSEEAKMRELSFLDYSRAEITRTLNRDPELKAIAQSNYKPYPMHDGWSEEYKVQWASMAETGKAPGFGEVPDEVVRHKLGDILDKIVETVVVPRKLREAEEKARKAEILSHVVSVETDERITFDEGGKTTEYIHHVLMPSGKTYIFLDRNVFDVGRVINYNGAFLSNKNGVLGWNHYIDGAGWEFEPVEEDDEAVLAYRAAALYGFAGSTIRM